jgi:light-regulated signal transduction histidine kinase (bacteriophytochrome)
VCGISSDITERKRAEEELKRTAVELARSNADLEQFAYASSHDLQEPLRMIASYLQLLVRRYQGKLDQDADDFIGFAVDGALRMQGLINDLLAYSRVGTRGKPFEPTDCGEALKQALANLRVALEECSAVVTHDGLPRVMGDATQLTQLFQNLLSNSIKFRSAARPEIRVSAKLNPSAAGAAWPLRAGGPPSPEWVISVQDNGIGIDREHFERIFIIFQRLHTRDRYSGSGIGLSICKKIIERHSGRIWVDSEAGQGAVFHFTLPHTEAAPRDGGTTP